MSDIRNIRVKARAWVEVDEVAIEQAGIERQSADVRENAVAAAWEHPDVLALKKVCDRNQLPIRVKTAGAIANGAWRIIFLIGHQHDNDNDRAA